MSSATRRTVANGVIACGVATLLGAITPAGVAAQAAKAPQKIDAEYTAKIKEVLQDPRISTELVDHLPASDTVPTPLKFHGRIVGQPGELTYSKDINRYLEAIDKASDRATMWTIGKSEEGRDIVLMAIADEATIKQLSKYKEMLAQLTDPRKTTEAQAQQLLKTAKPIYYVTSGMHSPETGGPEMLQELAYRLVVEETPFIQQIRNNVITFITPVVEVDGREKQVDTYYYGKKTGKQRPPLMYWGKYVAHDNNRDGMGQLLELTRSVNRVQLEWKPTIMHDLHEAQTYLYASTGTGPYNEQLDPITVDEWWLLAKNDVMEMTKRGVPGVWTYGFYDGWVPNYMFFIAHSHNAIGRFYEVQSYGPDPYDVRPGATTTSKEWFRPNPPLAEIKWGPRNNTNIQESALLFALNHVAKNRELYLENYWLKNKRAVDKGKNGPVYGWVVPASQRAKYNAADMVNELRKQGAEIHTANAAFKAGNVQVEAGDWVIRGDQPYRTLVDMYTAIQNYSPVEPAAVRRHRLDDAVDAEREAAGDHRQVAARSADDGHDRECEAGWRHRWHGIDARDRSHDRQLARDTALQARQREDVRRGRGLRGGRPEVPRRFVHHRQRGSRDARADAQGSEPDGDGGRGGAHCQDARPRRAADWLRSQLGANAGRRMGARGLRSLRGALHLLLRYQAPRRRPALEVRRDRVPAHRRNVAVAGQRPQRQRGRCRTRRAR